MFPFLGSILLVGALAQSPDDDSSWTVLYARGRYGTLLTDENEFNELVFNSSTGTGSIIIRRECSDCASPFDLVYVKLRSRSVWSSPYKSLLVTWTEDDGNYGTPTGFLTDFSLYSSFEEARQGSNAWQFCNGGDPGIGFPRDCAPTYSQRQSYTWNSLTRSPSVQHYRFSVSVRPNEVAWIQVAYIGGAATVTANASGDSDLFSEVGSKMSDDYINKLQFSIVKFEPADERYPTTYFNFNGRVFASETAVPCSEYALNESDALMGQWSKDSCAAYDVCNFGRGHCDYTVKSAFGWANYGGCGNGPIIGTSGIKSGDVRIYVNHMGYMPATTTLTSITSTLTSTLTSTTAPAMAAVGLVESVGATPVNNLAIALEVLAGLLLMCGAVLLARYHCPHQKPQKEPVIQGSRFVGVFGRLRSQHVLDKTKDPAWAAISLRQLDELRVGAKSALGDKYATSNMHDVNREVIQPICNEHHKCYAHFANAEELLKVNVFVSHAWLENFDMFVDAVNSAFQNWTGKPNIWICATALIQSTDPSVVALQVGAGDDPSEAPFTKALCQADKLLVVRNDVCDLYDRIWCCWELYYAYEQGLVHRPGALMVVGPSSQCDAFKHVDVATAQASNMDDKRKILSHILQSAERYSDINKALTEVKFFGASEIDQRV